MAVYSKGKSFFVKFVSKGKQVREFGFETAAEAEAWEMASRAALLLGKPLPRALVEPGRGRGPASALSTTSPAT